MNEHQTEVIADMIKSLKTMSVDDLKQYHIVSSVIGFIASVVGISLLCLSMLIPGMIMFIATAIIGYMAFQISTVTDVMKREIKNIIKIKNTDK